MSYEQPALHNTVVWLRRLVAARAAGKRAAFTTDPRWLVNMAVNRRAAWPDDPSRARGSARPTGGRYPKKAEGTTYHHLRLLACRLNTPRLIVREQELGEWRKLLMQRIPDRITTREDEAW